MTGLIIYKEIERVLLYDYNFVSVSNRYEVVIYISLGVFLFLTSYSYSLVVSSFCGLYLGFFFGTVWLPSHPLGCKEWSRGSGSFLVGV